MAVLASFGARAWRDRIRLPRIKAFLFARDLPAHAHAAPPLGAIGSLLALCLGSLGFISVLVLPITWPDASAFEQGVALVAILTLGLALIISVVPALANLQWHHLLVPAIAASLTAFAVPLAIAWSHGTNNGSLIGGLLPFSDAFAYVNGAWKLLDQGVLDRWNMRRPLNAALHAFRMFVSGGNLMGSLALMAWLIGLGSLLAATRIYRTVGWAAAGVFLCAWILFVDRWLPLTLSEAHGCLLGIVGFALIWQSGIDRRASTFGIGIAVFSLALAARAGPFFMLPSLLVWGVVFLGATVRQRLLIALAGGIGVSIGQSVPKLFNLLWGDGGNALYSNFAMTFYGMTAGGKRWNAVKTEHPELFALLDEGADRASQIYQLAIDQFLADPGLLFGFIFRELVRFPEFIGQHFLVPANASAFWLLLLLSGGIWAVINLRHALSGLLLSGAIGLWLSSPFLMQDGGARVFAAGGAWIAVWPALGAFALIKAASWLTPRPKGSAGVTDVDHPDTRNLSPVTSMAPALVGGITFGLAICGPVVAVKSFPASRPTASASCLAGQSARVIDPARTTIALHAVPEATSGLIKVPKVRVQDLKNGLRTDRIPFMAKVIEQRPPYSLMLTYDLTTSNKRRPSFFAIRRHEVPPWPQDSLIGVCGIETCFDCRGGTIFDIHSWHRIPAAGF